MIFNKNYMKNSLRIKIRSLFFILKVVIYKPKYFLLRSTVPFSTRIESGVDIRKSNIGKYCSLGKDSKILNVKIGNYCSLAPAIQIGGSEHAWWWGSTSQRMNSGYDDSTAETVIEDDVWIGTHSVIRQGVNIGRGAVIGACSLVLKDVPPYAIVFGNPAKIRSKRFSSNVVKKVENTKFWEKSPKEAQKLLDSIDYPKPEKSTIFGLLKSLQT